MNEKLDVCVGRSPDLLDVPNDFKSLTTVSVNGTLSRLPAGPRRRPKPPPASRRAAVKSFKSFKNFKNLKNFQRPPAHTPRGIRERGARNRRAVIAAP